MRNWILGAILTVALYSFANGQTAPAQTARAFESDTTVGTSWDSVYVGPQDAEKWIEFLNDGSVSLYVTMANDTVTAKPSSHKWWTVKAGEKFFIARVTGRFFVRTRSASSTVSRRIHVGYK
jgi:hypothetical protein